MNLKYSYQNLLFYVAILLCVSLSTLQSQSLELQSFSSSGEQLSSTKGISLSSIIGEIATENLEGSDLRLTQGFHQIFKIISHANEVENTFDIILFPNPTLDQITLKSKGAENKLMVHIYNVNGQKVNSSQLINKSLSIPFSDYPTGNYYAIVRDAKGKVVDQIPFQKINN